MSTPIEEYVRDKVERAPTFKPQANGHDKVRELAYVFGNQLDVSARVYDDELAEGLIGKLAMAVLYGDSNSGKTFLAIDIAAAIVQGIDWMGRRTVPGLVVYLATEAPASVEMRVIAYRKRHGVELANLVIVESPINLFDGSADIAATIAVVRKVERERGQKAALIIGDTLARIAAGANENSGEDMGVVIRNAEAIRSACDCAFMWIHHCGKDAAKGMRGWSGMRAAIDTEIEITETEAGRCAEVTKQRDLPGKGDRFGFRLEVVCVGVNLWHNERTSCVVVPDKAPAKKAKGRPSEVDGAIRVFLAQRKTGCKLAELAATLSEKPFTYARGSVYRAAKKMVEAKILHETAGIVALVGLG